MGSSRGYAGLIQNPELLASVSYDNLADFSEADREQHLRTAMWQAKVRMPDQKANWLAKNFIRIDEMGGVEAATKVALALPSRDSKLTFMMQFDGIGPKYGRNVWMDIYDPEFRDAIAVDERIKKVTDELGYNFNTYEEQETFFQEIAREVGLEPWELDRLLYQFTDHFIDALSF